MDTNSMSDRVIDQWWFSWYFHIPPCAHIRLLQSSGSCWVNASINALFMITRIGNLFIDRYNDLSRNKKEKYKIELNDFGNKKYGLKELLISLMYHLLIKGTKPQDNDGNFVGYLSSHINCVENKKKEKCNDIRYGDGGYPQDAVKHILETLLYKEDYLMLNDEDKLNKSYKKTTYPSLILIFGEKKENIKKRIIFDNKKYILCSSIITLDITTYHDHRMIHTISGIICHGKSYVYDSNNILVETRWDDGEDGLKDYYDDNMTKKLYSKIEFLYFDTLIYLLDNK